MFFKKSHNNIFNIKSFNPIDNQLVERASYNEGSLKIYNFNDLVVGQIDLSTQYVKNAIVRIVVDKIANTISSLEPVILDIKNHKKSLDHPANNILKRPNREQIWSELIGDLVRDHFLFGVYYLYCKSKFNDILYLKRILPTSVKGSSNDNLGNVLNYEIKIGDETLNFKNYPYDDPKCLMLKQTFYNPSSSNFKDNGLSPLSSAEDAINHINSANNFNLSFINNGARPSIAFVVEPKDGYDGFLTDEQRNTLLHQLSDGYSGSKNAGKPILLEGGIKIQNMSSSIKDMDFSELMEMSIQVVCALMGIPVEECGIGSQAKNYSSEAKKSFIMDTCIPYANILYKKLDSFIMPKFEKGEERNYILTYNRSNINLLMKDILDVMVKAKNTEVYTTNEVRNINNLDNVEYGDEVRVGIGTAPLGTTLSKNFETINSKNKEKDNETKPNTNTKQ